MRATERELDVQEWAGYFGWVAFASRRMLASVEVVGEQRGDVGEQRGRARKRVWRALRAINYDAEADVLTLAVGGRDGSGLPFRRV
jgi:hypothetical protein